MTLIGTLQEKRKKTWHDASEILDRAQAEKRDLTRAEQTRFDTYMGDMDALSARIDKMADDERSGRRADEAMRELEGQPKRAAYLPEGEREIDAQFRNAVRSGSRQPIEVAPHVSEYRSGYQPGIELRDLATTSGSGLVGTTFFGRIERHMVASSAILSAGATVIQSASGETLKVPKSTAFSTAAIVAEGDTISESDPTLGSVSLGAYKYGFLVQVTQELVEDENFDLLGFLAEQTGIAIGNAFGAHAITGTGTAQPTGILTGATLGVTGPTGTATTFGTHTTAGQGGDLLLDLAGSLADPYQRSSAAAWIMRAATLNAIRKLRDSTGNYVFSTDVIPGSGAYGTLLGRPVFLDPTMPAMAANAKSVLFGDISKYWVRRVNGLRFQQSNDFAFDKDLVTFRGLARLDGNLIDTTGAVKYFAHSAT